MVHSVNRPASREHPRRQAKDKGSYQMRSSGTDRALLGVFAAETSAPYE